MAHYVNCIYCKKRFDRDKVSTVQVSARRYAHKECAENYENNKSQEEKDIEALEKYIMKLFNEDYVNARVRKQIKEYREQYQSFLNIRFIYIRINCIILNIYRSND